jgi:hypothetical protein
MGTRKAFEPASGGERSGGMGQRCRLLVGALLLALAAGSPAAFAHDPDHPLDFYRAIDLEELHGIVEAMHEGADPRQSARIDALVAAAAPELRQLSQRAMAAHRRKVDVLPRDVIDRPALARAQRDELAASDALSIRIDKALATLAETLTPAQRDKFRAHAHASGSAVP